MRAVSLTNRGGRSNNEDHISYAEKNGMWCFVVCDGLGGQVYGEIASRIVADTICDEFQKQPEISQTAVYGYAKRAVEALDEARRADAEKYNMSTTVVVLLTNGKEAVWLHVGDSRLYCFASGEMRIVTEDHSLAFMEFMQGEISYDGIRKSHNQNILTRCMSDAVNFEPDVSDVVEVEKGSAFLLCTDGFWEYVNEDEMQSTLSEASSPKEWLEKMLELLHKNEIEYNDNYSVIAIMP